MAEQGSTERDRAVRERAGDYCEVAANLERNVGVPGAIILAAMLISEGLHAVASAMETGGDIELAAKEIADAIKYVG